jgi:deazaflavin-dependent oxidoreductase (nitroreductase family)
MRTMAEITPEYNAKIIAGFRSSRGRVGGTWEETPLLLLHHTGAKSGVSRVNPVAHLPDGSRFLIWAANGGAPNHPDWYSNLMARANARIEVGSETIDVWPPRRRARNANGASLEQLSATRNSSTLRGAPRASFR